MVVGSFEDIHTEEPLLPSSFMLYSLVGMQHMIILEHFYHISHVLVLIYIYLNK
jgi:hypothetical protein